ncbi:tetratricopeptide repeat protein [Micromonospora sp. NPDC049274]|uniref:tetratricopeptide repeat protein n=1 Tax=Micromonospora sp. NPDC049274 TaxID=3154829 RepID=UPI0034492C66
MVLFWSQTKALYSCRESCRSSHLVAVATTLTVVQAIRARAPKLLPTRHVATAALLLPEVVASIRIGLNMSDLWVQWRQHPAIRRQPGVEVSSQVRHARELVASGSLGKALHVLGNALATVDPDSVQIRPSEAEGAVLLAELAVRCGRPRAATRWAEFGLRACQSMHGIHSAPTLAALRVLASSYRYAGQYHLACPLYRELADTSVAVHGDQALSTLAARASHALMLYETGHCIAARRQLSATISAHRDAYPLHSDSVRMTEYLNVMRQRCEASQHVHRKHERDADLASSSGS